MLDRKIIKHCLNILEESYSSDPLLLGKMLKIIASDAVCKTTKELQLSEKEKEELKKVLFEIINEAEYEHLALAEFNLRESGLCDECHRVVLSERDGFVLTKEKDIDRCPRCQLKHINNSPLSLEEIKEKRRAFLSGISPYGRRLLLGAYLLDLWEVGYDEFGRIVIKDVFVEKDEMSKTTLNVDDLKKLGIEMSIQEELPERSNPVAPNLKLEPMKIYTIILPEEMSYLPSKGNSRYWRELIVKGKVEATVFAKHGQYIEFKSIEQE